METGNQPEAGGGRGQGRIVAPIAVMLAVHVAGLILVSRDLERSGGSFSGLWGSWNIGAAAAMAMVLAYCLRRLKEASLPVSRLATVAMMAAGLDLAVTALLAYVTYATK